MYVVTIHVRLLYIRIFLIYNIVIVFNCFSAGGTPTASTRIVRRLRHWYCYYEQ